MVSNTKCVIIGIAISVLLGSVVYQVTHIQELKAIVAELGSNFKQTTMHGIYGNGLAPDENTGQSSSNMRDDRGATGGDEDLGTVAAIKQLREQRDALSSALKLLSKEFHQYQCEMEDNDIAEHGGWCSNKIHMTDKGLANALAELFQEATVASFGDGTGGYKKLIDKSGKVESYDSFDGAPFCENRTNGLVKYLDLSIPVYGLKLYDWVISLEVAEHIPNKYEHIYLDNVVRHAAKGIVLSWALPKQPGHGHVNGQPLDYVVKQLSKRGFYQDLEMSYRLQNASSVWWLKQNINAYKRKHGKNADIIMV